MSRLLSVLHHHVLPVLAAGCVFTAVAASPVHAQEGRNTRRGKQPAPPVILQPLDLGLEEEVGVSLLMLDVQVLDREGRPLPGLTMADFELFLDGKRQQLEAVDDFCACGTMAAPAAETPRPAMTPATADGEPSPAGGPAPISRRFALLVDFSQLQLQTRDVALEHARRWLAQALQTGDQAMVAGFSTAAGLQEVVAFTEDRDALVSGLEEAFADPRFRDPFPTEFPLRRQECERCLEECARDGYQLCERGCCFDQARDEALHSRRSLEALDLFLTSLESVPGPKHVIFFNQNTTVEPALLYPQLADLAQFDVGDHRQLTQSVAASATAARATLHVATIPEAGTFSSPVNEGARDLGTRLADFTGGTTNRSLADLDVLLAAAGRTCCTYRLSIPVPENPPNRPMRVRVMVRGQRLPGDYRVQFYDPQQRWFRHARAALAAPARLRDPAIQVALFPTYLRDNRWVVEVQTTFALADLELVPGIDRRVGRWRVGALLESADGNRSWEMFSMARATLAGLGETQLQALHERRVGSLEPGRYALRLFVEDAQRNKFGAGQVSVELPADVTLHAGEPWLYGPALSRRVSQRLQLGLPFVTGEPPVPMPVAAPSPGMVPVNEEGVAAGSVVSWRSVLCPAPAAGADLETVSILLRGTTPMARLEKAHVRRSGRCATVIDEADTTALQPGHYTYRLMLKTDTEEAWLSVDAPLQIQPAAGLEPGSNNASVSPDISTQKP